MTDKAKTIENLKSESSIEDNLYSEVKKLKGICLKLVTIHFLGLPDRLVLLPGGNLFFAELKRKGLEPSHIQNYVHKKLRKLGFKVYVIDSISTTQAILNEYR